MAKKGKMKAETATDSKNLKAAAPAEGAEVSAPRGKKPKKTYN